MAEHRAKLDLDDIENIKKIVVTPAVATVEEKLRSVENACIARDARGATAVASVVQQLSALEARIASLERDRKRAMIGYGIISALAAAVMAACFDWIKRSIIR